MQQVDLINDDQLYKLCIGTVATLTGDDVPLFRCSDDDLLVGCVICGWV